MSDRVSRPPARRVSSPRSPPTFSLWHNINHSVWDRLAEWLLAAWTIGFGWTLIEIGEGMLAAMLCIAVGTARIVVLGINGAWRRSPHARVAACFVSAGLWGAVALWFGLAWPVAVAAVFGEAVSSARAIKEAGCNDAVKGSG